MQNDSENNEDIEKDLKDTEILKDDNDKETDKEEIKDIKDMIEGLNDEKSEKGSSNKDPQDFKMITEVKDQVSDKSSHSSSHSSMTKRIENLPDYNQESSKKSNKSKKGGKKSIGSMADVSKNITLNTQSKVIQYKFEDLTLSEFQKRINNKSELIIENLPKRITKQLLVDLMTWCRIVPKPEEVQIFSKILKQFKSSEKNKPESHTLDTFKQLCEKWYNEVHFPKDLKSKLVFSIKEYETMKSKMMPSDDPTFIDSLITMLKTQLRKISEFSSKESISSGLEDRARGGCHEVFLHYSKNPVNPTLSMDPSHSRSHKFETLNLSKFLKFCEDFNILEKHKNPAKNRIKQETLEKIFEDNSTPKKTMFEFQFFQALENLAVIFFDLEYDLLHKTQWVDLPDELKVTKLFEVLGFHEPSIYARKMKGNKYSDLNSLMKYSFDVSKSYNLTPKIYSKNRSIERMAPYQASSKTSHSKSNSVKKYNPVTWEQLAKEGNEDAELMNLINEDSSEDEDYKPGHKIVTNSISQKILKRADELNRKENEKLMSLMKIAENKSERQSNLTKKFRK